MKKKLFALLLALALLLAFTGCCSHEWLAATCEAPKTCTKCAETEGEALGHSWVDATCDSPKTCSACKLTEGAALGHTWVDATTEAPKTCTVCAATEGERIITDERFTTASTSAIQGQWTAVDALPAAEFGLDGMETDLKFNIVRTFGKDGTMITECTPANEEEFSAAMADWVVANIINTMAANGYSEELTRQTMEAQYGMTLEEYAATSMEGMDLPTIISTFNFSGVYYVEGDQLYNASTWSANMEPSTFTLEGDTLTLSGNLGAVAGGELVFSRTSE